MEIPARMTREGGVCPAFQIDECFAEEVGKLKWTPHGSGYFVSRVNGKRVTLHRYIWLLHTGEWPKMEIDHINRDSLDNRIANLRDVSHSDNMKNRPPMLGVPIKKKSGFPTGVYCQPNRRLPYYAYIWVNGKQKRLGRFLTPEEASARYQREVESMKAALSQT
jgi:hypothetical protein